MKGTSKYYVVLIDDALETTVPEFITIQTSVTIVMSKFNRVTKFFRKKFGNHKNNVL